MSAFDSAKRYATAGLSVLSIKSDGTKEPASSTWKEFQTRIPTPTELNGMFGRNGVGVGIIGGRVSGNLEILDVDEAELVEPVRAAIEENAPGLLARLTQIKTPRPGLHLTYRHTADPEGNLKLAKSEPCPQFDKFTGEPVIDPKTGQQRIAPNTLIETRGEGGYVVAPGSPRECHHTGRCYEHVGGPPLTAVQTITVEERDVLLSVGRSFNLLVDESPTEHHARALDGTTPGDDYASKTPWESIIGAHGWAKVSARGEVTTWRRPGKSRGISATTGLTSKNGADLLCIFSSNAYPFDVPSGKTCGTYTKFAAYALLEHGGDFSAAAKALSAQGYGDKLTRPTTSFNSEGRPRIDATCDDLPKVTAQAWDAIEKSNDPPTLFRYGGCPTRIEQGDHNEPITVEVDEDRMKHHLARAAEWFKLKKVGKEEVVEVPASPPDRIVKDVLATPNMPLPKLTRIVEAPVFAPDGTLQIEPGYHPASKTFYAPRAGFSVPTVSGQPTAEEVREARNLLSVELLGDFPFVGQSELAHALALLLLPAARDLIDGPTPLHLIEKPSPGTGATLLGDLIALPPTGRPIPAMTEGRDEDEWRKRITAKLCGASTFLFIDNLRHRLDSGAVSSAITSPMWEDRCLGFSKMLRIPVRCVWLASGNNPAVSSEIARRTVRIRLDAKQDRPWLRDGFRHPNLREWATGNRGRLVWATLTLIKAWIVAGRPLTDKAIGMFDDWSKVMGGILDVARVPGFLGNLEEFYEESDSEGSVWRAFLGVWWQEHHDRECKVAELFKLCNREGEEVPLPIGDGNEQSRKVRLGKLLTQARDRIFDVSLEGEHARLRIRRGDQRQRTYGWQLESLGEVVKTNAGECGESSECFPPMSYTHAPAPARTCVERSEILTDTHDTHTPQEDMDPNDTLMEASEEGRDTW